MNGTVMVLTSVKEQQQDQIFVVLKVLFHLSSPWASQLAHEGGTAGVIFLQQMRQQAYGHAANKERGHPGKFPSPHGTLFNHSNTCQASTMC